MRVLLRDARTGSYVGREMPWVEKAAAAAEFETVEAAGRKALESERKDLIIALRYESPECELALDPVQCLKNVGGGGLRARI